MHNMRKHTLSGATVHIDAENWDWHIDLHPPVSERACTEAVAFAERLGMEVYDSEECEPETLTDGTMRIYMSPKEAIPT